MKYLEVLFNEGESKCFSDNVWGIHLSDAPGPNTEFVSLNPLNGTRRTTNVVIFRNILIELDKGSIDSQLAYITKIGLPHSTLTFSGGKSVHCIISLKTPAKDLEEYRRLVELVYTAYDKTKLDGSCKDPSRLTRLADGFRKDKGAKQTNLYTGARISDDVLHTWLIKRLGMNKWRSMLLPTKRPLRLKKPKEIKSLSKNTKALIEDGVCSEVSRHSSFIKAAAQMVYTGYDYEEIFDLLEQPFESIITERSIKELKDIVNWATRNIKEES
jgi:hypothetical protein